MKQYNRKIIACWVKKLVVVSIPAKSVSVVQHEHV